jgi:hypothetical protein
MSTNNDSGNGSNVISLIPKLDAAKQSKESALIQRVLHSVKLFSDKPSPNITLQKTSSKPAPTEQELIERILSKTRLFVDHEKISD